MKVSEHSRLRLVALCGLGILASSVGLAQAPSPAKPSATASKTRPASAATSRKPRKAEVVKPEPVPEPLPVVIIQPPPPPTPGEMPPNPPSVVYADGDLTIVAQNSTLSSILKAVSGATGATLDVPAGGGNERVWGQFGPGPARAVVTDLLGGSNFDYAIQAADDDPTRLQSILLTPRGGGDAALGSGSQGASSQSASSKMELFRHKTDSYSAYAQGLEDSGAGATANDSAAVDAGPASPVDTPPSTAQADTPSGAGVPSDSTSASLGSRPPVAVTEAEAHPTAISDPQQAIPQMQNLFDLRRQIQQQQNAQQKTVGSH